MIQRTDLVKLLTLNAAKSDIGLLILDAQNMCVYVNPAANDMLGAETGDLQTQKISVLDGFDLEHLERQRDVTIQAADWLGTIRRYYEISFYRLEDALGRYVGCCFQIYDRTDQVLQAEKEKALYTIDEISGVYNRVYFMQKAQEYLRENSGKQMVLVCSNIIHFKVLNELFGVAMGDKVLRRIGDALKKMAGRDCIYGRIFGDHFALVMPKEKFNEQYFVEVPKQVAYVDAQQNFPITIHCGVYEIPLDDPSIEEALERGQMVLSNMREDYSTAVAYYDDILRDDYVREQTIIGLLEEAIQLEEFQMYLQPQFHRKKGVKGAEALIRWIHPKKGVISPARFMPIVEERGLITQLDQMIWRQACKQIRDWRKRGYEDYYISINISPKDFIKCDVYEVIMGLVKEYEIPPSSLRIEITESAVVNDIQTEKSLVSKLQEAGFQIEMDDFGSGYSALNVLKDVSVNTIKVDMEFMKGIETNHRARVILEMIVKMARGLGTEIIVEGVENQSQMDFLEEIECDIYQGACIGMPMPVEEFEKHFLN